MLITYHKTALQGCNLAGFCEDIKGVQLREVDSMDALLKAAEDSTALMFNNPLYNQQFADALQGSPVRWIQLSSTGFDACTQYGVPDSVVVTNAASAWAPIVAEHALALMLGLLRGVHIAERDRQSAKWDRPSVLPHLSSLEGATVGILGAGAIGQEIGKRVQAFGARALFITRTPRTLGYADETVPVDEVFQALPRVDVLVSALPLTAQTDKMVNRAWFEKMKKSSLFINVGRGNTVDESAILQSLEEGLIAGAGFDVMEVEPMRPDHPLWQFKQVIITPHVAAFKSRIGTDRLMSLCRNNIENYMAGRKLMNVVLPAP